MDDDDAVHLGADLVVGRVDERGDHEAPLPEPRVVGERMTEVAHADDDAGPVVGEPELAADVEEQVLDVVADAPGPVAAEVRQVLAHLGGVDPGHLGQPLRRDRRQLGVGDLLERPQVHRKARHRRLGDLPEVR